MKRIRLLMWRSVYRRPLNAHRVVGINFIASYVKSDSIQPPEVAFDMKYSNATLSESVAFDMKYIFLYIELGYSS